MRIFDLEKWIFYSTAFAIAVVFVFLTPSTHIITRWFPGKTDRLWLYPELLFSAGFSLWSVYRFSLTFLVRWGVFEDRRLQIPRVPLSNGVRLLRWILPAVRLLFHVLLLAGICAWALALMREGFFGKIFYQNANRPDYASKAL